MRARAHPVAALMLTLAGGGGCNLVFDIEPPTLASGDGEVEGGAADGEAPRPEATAPEGSPAQGADSAGAEAAPDASAPAGDAGDGASCGDVQSDPLDCGRCGHGCGGGTCVSGTCQPVTLASGQLTYTDAGVPDVMPAAVAVDDTNVYWITQDFDAATGGLYACAKTGCGGQPRQLASGLASAYDLAIDPVHGNALWVSITDGAVYTCPLPEGCPGGAPVAFATGQTSPLGIAVDPGGTTVFWTNNPGTTSSLMACPTTGCPFTPQIVLGGLTTIASGVVASAADAYVLTQSSEQLDGGTVLGTVQACPLGGCLSPPQILADQLHEPGFAAVDTTAVYWTDIGPNKFANSGGVLSVPLTASDGASTIVASNTNPIRIAVDATYVYFANTGTLQNDYADGSIDYCPKSGCLGEPTHLVQNVPFPDGLATDEEFVYFSVGLNGTIEKVAKP